MTIAQQDQGRSPEAEIAKIAIEARRSALDEAAALAESRAVARHGYDKYGDGDAIRALAR